MSSVSIFSKNAFSIPGFDIADQASTPAARRARAPSNARAFPMGSQGSPRGGGRGGVRS